MNYYEMLGVSKNSSEDEIKKAYKRWISENHPDKNPDDKSLPEKIKGINEAYSVLSDPDKRRQYDQKSSGNPWEEILKPFSQHYREVFRHDSPLNMPGDDVFVNVVIGLDESFHGTKTSVGIEDVINCSVCGGTGGKPGSRQVTCGTCAGLGYIDDPFSVSRNTCPSCQGKKTRAVSQCLICSGTGKSIAKRNISISIPQGVRTEDKLRVTGKGKPGNPSGDLYLNIILRESPNVYRLNDDLIMEEVIPISLLMFGGSHQVTTPWAATHDLLINPETAPGSKYEVKGAGFRYQGRTGNLVVILQPRLPRIKSEAHKEALFKLLKDIEASN